MNSRSSTSRVLRADTPPHRRQRSEAAGDPDLAKPAIRERQLDPWSTRLRELARRPNVYCRASGLATPHLGGTAVEVYRL